MNNHLKIGLVGCGFIGTELAKKIEQNSRAELVAIMDSIPNQALQLERTLSKKPRILELPALIEESDLVIEAAHPSIVPRLVEQCITSQRHLMVMSVGGLLEESKQLKTAREHGLTIAYPSGAIAGLDGIRAAARSGITRALLTTTKSPKSLGLSSQEKHTVFEGNVHDAIARFPQNVNVAATLALACADPALVTVKIVCDPTVHTNTHEILIEAASGKMHFRFENTPSVNPKTSMLALLSAQNLLSELIENFEERPRCQNFQREL